MKNEIKTWQYQLAFWGTILWIVFLSNTKYILEKLPQMFDFTSGYALGYIMTFFGFIFWCLLEGKLKKEDLLSNGETSDIWYKEIIKRLSNIHTIILFVVCFIMAFLICLMHIFSSLYPSYLIGVLCSAIVVNQGVLKVVSSLDNE